MMAMSRFLLHILCVAVLLFGLTVDDACAKAKKSKKTVKSELSAEQQRKHDYFFLEAQRQQLQGNYPEAMELYAYCIGIDPHSDAALYEMSKYYLLLKNDSLARVCLERAVDVDPHNYWYKDALVNYYVSKRDNDSAIEVLESMCEQFPEKSEILMRLVDLYGQNSDYEKVISTLDRLELLEGKSEQISMEKFRIYLQMNDTKRAFAEIENLCNEYPNDLRYRVVLGDLYLDSDKPDEAMKVYKEVWAKDSLNVNLMLSLATYYSKTNNDSLYNLQLEKIVTNQAIDSRVKYAIMNGLVYDNLSQKEDSSRILNLFRNALACPQDGTEIAELCARYMVTKGVDTSEVKPVLYQMLEIDPENDMARNQLLSYAIQANDTMGIINVCKPAVDYAASDPVYYYYLGIAYYQQKKASDALAVFKKGLDHVGKDTSIDLVANLYSLMGDMYHEVGDDEKAFTAYDSCLVYKPDDAMALNNYAYYLSLKKTELDKAESMSAKSLEKEPDNYTYIDTYAWILFCQKRYAEAKDYIDKAIKIMNDNGGPDEGDGNIIEHAGDIYFMHGDVDGALRMWKRAEKLGTDSKTLKKKIQLRKYIE